MCGAASGVRILRFGAGWRGAAGAGVVARNVVKRSIQAKSLAQVRVVAGSDKLPERIRVVVTVDEG